jgi:hypothetical protein
MSMVQRYSHLSPGTLREVVSMLNGNLKTKRMENLRKEKQPGKIPINGTVKEMNSPLASERGETEL